MTNATARRNNAHDLVIGRTKQNFSPRFGSLVQPQARGGPNIFANDAADIAANQPRRFGLERALEKHGVTIQFSITHAMVRIGSHKSH
jgi:hypothetical protein